MEYREFMPPAGLRGLVEAVWVLRGPAAPVRVVPDGCMDLIRMQGRIVIAGPDTTASTSMGSAEPYVGLRFRPGALPRLLGVPANELRDERVPLDDVRSPRRGEDSLVDLAARLASREPNSETAPWPLPVLRRVTASLAAGSTVADVAADIGWSARTVQRQCAAVYGYGPATLRRILRFRRAQRLLRAGVPIAETAHVVGYSDQSHLCREVRELAGVSPRALRQDGSGAYRSTQLPSGSATVAYRCPHGAS